MNKKAVKVLVDILMFISMCFLAGTGLLIHYRLVPGNRGRHGLTLLDLSRHEWGTYHLWAAYFLLFLVLVHLVLNYAFIRNVIAAGKPCIMVVLGLLGLLITLFFLLMPIERAEDDTQGRGDRYRGRHPDNAQRIDGQKPAP